MLRICVVLRMVHGFFRPAPVTGVMLPAQIHRKAVVLRQLPVWPADDMMLLKPRFFCIIPIKQGTEIAVMPFLDD